MTAVVHYTAGATPLLFTGSVLEVMQRRSNLSYIDYQLPMWLNKSILINQVDGAVMQVRLWIWHTDVYLHYYTLIEVITIGLLND